MQSRLAQYVIEKMNAFLGIQGRPHLVFIQGRWFETGCVEWSNVNSNDAAETNHSVELLAAFQKMYTEPDAEEPQGQAAVELYSAQVQALRQTYLTQVERLSASYAQREPATLGLPGVRQLLRDDAVFAYSFGTLFQFFPEFDKSGMTHNITVMPSANQLEALVVEETDGVNRGLMTGDIIAELGQLDQRFGVDLMSVGPDGLAYRLKRIPSGQQAEDLAQHLVTFCPDLYRKPEWALSAIQAGKIDLWWD